MQGSGNVMIHESNESKRGSRRMSQLLSLLDTSTIFSLLEHERFSECAKPNILDIVADSSGKNDRNHEIS